MTVTSKLHTQEYRDIELNIVIDEIGPGEGLLDSGGIEIPLKPAGKGGVAQFPAGSPVQATTCGQSAPMTEVACEDEDWERVVRYRGHHARRALSPQSSASYCFGRP